MQTAKLKKPLTIIIIVTVIGLLAGVLYASQVENQLTRTTAIDSETSDTKDQPEEITSFSECVEAGNPVMESFPEQCHANGTTFVNETQSITDGYSEPIVSGNSAFSVRLPLDWGEVLKPMDADWFAIPGMSQPEGELMINEIPGYGTDSPHVFSLLLHTNFAPPVGEPEAYTLVNAKENSISGTKYTRIYEEDTWVGIGVQRFKGDRDYTYDFDLGNGQTLRVHYSIYGQDPRNNIQTVEAIIDSIVIN